MLKNLNVILASDVQKLTLTYHIRPHEVAQRWATSVFHASTSSELKERRRFYNFSDNHSSELTLTLTRLQKAIDQLQNLHPHLNFTKIAPENIQESINTLHYHFAHSHHVTKLITVENQELWSNFNTLLHTVESILASARQAPHSSLPQTRIVFTWKNHFKVPIEESHYDQFCLFKTFGFAYANYSQVGRQIHEMWFAQDDSLADEHIQPSRFISADTLLWFGPSSGHSWQKAAYQKLEAWFNERETRFNSLGFYWGDPQLSLGSIPVAQLKNDIHTISEIQKFIEQLSQFDRIESVSVD